MFSTYYNGLSPSDKHSYLTKLTLVSSGIRLLDPFAIPPCQWLNDETKWPSIQWPEIYNYLIDTPSVYTREKLKAYKSLDAYNFVLCGHVQDILCHDYNVQNFVVLKTEVLPSQRQGKKTELYKAWVIVNKTNNCILTANCTAGYVNQHKFTILNVHYLPNCQCQQFNQTTCNCLFAEIIAKTKQCYMYSLKYKTCVSYIRPFFIQVRVMLQPCSCTYVQS